MADLTLSTIDRQSKPTSTSLPVQDATTNPQAQAIIDAYDALVLGADLRGVITVPNVVDLGSQVPPADDNANRGNKMLVRIQEAVTGKIRRYELGTFDNAQLPSPTDDFVDITAGNGLALKTAIEAVYETENGNAGTVLSIQQITRTD